MKTVKQEQKKNVMKNAANNSQDLEEFFKSHPHTEFSYGKTYSCKHNQIKVFFCKYRFGKYVSRSHGGSRLCYRRGAAEEVREPAVQLGPDKPHLQRLVDKIIIVVIFPLWFRQVFFSRKVIFNDMIDGRIIKRDSRI